MLVALLTSIQSNNDSIHSPHNERKTIINAWRVSVKFQRGMTLPANRSTFTKCAHSVYDGRGKESNFDQPKIKIGT